MSKRHGVQGRDRQHTRMCKRCKGTGTNYVAATGFGFGHVKAHTMTCDGCGGRGRR